MQYFGMVFKMYPPDPLRHLPVSGQDLYNFYDVKCAIIPALGCRGGRMGTEMWEHESYIKKIPSHFFIGDMLLSPADKYSGHMGSGKNIISRDSPVRPKKIFYILKKAWISESGQRSGI